MNKHLRTPKVLEFTELNPSQMIPDDLSPEDEEKLLERIKHIDPSQVEHMLDTHPFFMTEAPREGEENHFYDAMMALREEEAPETVAFNFKESGNTVFKEGPHRYKDAIDYYTNALDVNCSDQALNSLILSNRAQVQIALKNYGHAIKDCEKAIELDASNSKAYFRASKASLSLKKVEQSLSFARKGLSKSNSDDMNKSFRGLISKCKYLQSKIESQKNAKVLKGEQEDLKRVQFIDACERRGITFLEPLYSSERLYPSESYLNLEEDLIHWSVLILYPLKGVSDFIRDWREDITVGEMFSSIFSPKEYAPWDNAKEYRIDNISISLEGDHDQLYLARLTDPLYKLLQSSKKVKNTPVFQIIPRNQAKGS